MNKSVAIIGAGLSGSISAKALSRFVEVSVFEQDTKVGGRLRLNDQLSTTPYFTVSTPFFQTLVNRWEMEGIVKERSAWDVEISTEEMNTLNIDESCYVIQPNLLSLFDHLLKDVDVNCDTFIDELEQDNNKWRLFDISGQYLGHYDCVIFTSATQHVHHLIDKSPKLLTQIQSIKYSAIWTVTLTFNEAINMPFDSALFFEPELVNAYLLEDDVVFLVASPEWSESNAAMLESEVMHIMINTFFRLTEIKQIFPKLVETKFWPHKTPINTLNEDCLFDELTGIAACGDWCTSPRVEGAVLSGFSVADRVMKYLLKENQ